MKQIIVWIFILSVSSFYKEVQAWGNDKVKLKDIQTLTLRHGQMTTGRRSKPISQLQCIGGTAGCSSFVPQVVQCYNRGSDGYDIQWECKTDMDNAYRFGKVEVACEGYDYADDEYVLKGSCGLEYTLDFTKEGYEKKKTGHHDYYGGSGDHHQSSYHSSNNYSKKSSRGGMGDIIVIAIVCIIIYTLYKTCISTNNSSGDYPSGPDSYPRGPSWFGGGGGGGGYGGQPPPPGFRPEYTPDDSCSGARPSTGSGSSNFWTGAATGGILGYMFGSRNNPPTYSTGTRHSPGSDYFFGGSSGSPPSSSSSSSSTGTRTASGFGGTRRR